MLIIPHCLDNRLTDGGEVGLTHRQRFAVSGRIVILISVRILVDLSATVRLEGLGELKIIIAVSPIEPATFRFVKQCLNQLPYHFKTLRTAHITCLQLFYDLKT
jgi:hypothetical protein